MGPRWRLSASKLHPPLLRVLRADSTFGGGKRVDQFGSVSPMIGAISEEGVFSRSQPDSPPISESEHPADVPSRTEITVPSRKYPHGAKPSEGAPQQVDQGWLPGPFVLPPAVFIAVRGEPLKCHPFLRFAAVQAEKPGAGDDPKHPDQPCNSTANARKPPNQGPFLFGH